MLTKSIIGGLSSRTSEKCKRHTIRRNEANISCYEYCCETHPNWRRYALKIVLSRSSRGRLESPPISQASAAGCNTVRLSCPPFRSTISNGDKSRKCSARMQRKFSNDRQKVLKEVRCQPRA